VRRRKPKDEIEDRLYIRISECAEPGDFRRIKEFLSKRVGSVRDCGTGPVKDPGAAWFEVHPRARIREYGVVKLLREHGLLDRVDDCYPISRGYGKVHARQLDLFQVG
jgi:hypothetical protein